MSYNGRVQSFVSGATSFTASAANGVYAESGSADAPQMLNRIIVTGSGAIHDVDGTADAATVPPMVTQDFLFQGANPGAHAQYVNLCDLVGKHGTLTLATPGASSTATENVTARLMRVTGGWTPPYQQGKTNTMAIRAEWQLKGLL
jgi:hypothetical protein